jgi:small subunit ribosomal protein S4
MNRRPARPGVHGANPVRGRSEFGKQLSMKQKIKHIYGVLERQFRVHFEECQGRPGSLGDRLLERLECRLDNVVYRSGIASSRSMARQMVGYNFFVVNGKRMDIPSYEVKSGDIIEVKTTKAGKNIFTLRTENIKGAKAPHWLEVNADKLTIKVVGMPKREDIGVTVDPQLVVEYYSK